MCILALVALAGCSGPEGGGSSNDSVFYGQTARIRGFDPARSGDVASSVAIARIYEGLLQYSYLKRPYQVEPNLAAEMPAVSRDGLTYTFRVRKGIFFQDDPCFGPDGKGRELNAADFVYSIKRVADVKNQSPGYWAFNDRIAGLDEFRAASTSPEPTDYDMDVAGLHAPNPHTLVIKLKRPYPQLPWIMTMHYTYAVAREAVEYYGTDFLNHPVGTGPYILKSWKRNYRIEFAGNPRWEETGRVERYPSEGEPGDAEDGLLQDAGKPIPFIDRVVNYVIDDSLTQWLKFLTGELEASGISRDNWDVVITPERELAENLRKRDIRLYTTPTLDVYYIGFNMDDPVVGRNRKLRQALTCAFNSEEWIEFYNGRIVRAKGPIPPTVEGTMTGPSPYGFDLDKARRLLAEAGYPKGISEQTGKRLQLTIELGSADADTRESTELTQAFFRRIGVILNPSYNNWPTFLNKMERRQCQLYRLGWVADYPDAENFLQLFYGPNSSPGPNHSNYVNKEFDRLYEQVRVLPDSRKRTELYRRMAAIVVEDCPWIFMHHPMSYALTHSWLKNYKPHDFPYGMGKYRNIDAEGRLRWRLTHGQAR